jgi:hypothetical protein
MVIFHRWFGDQGTRSLEELRPLPQDELELLFFELFVLELPPLVLPAST